MKRARANQEGWYRRNWKVVLQVWGILLSLFAAMSLILWFAVLRRKPVAPHVHVHTSLQVVAPSDEYPLATCIVSGKPLRPLPHRVAVNYDGIEVQFCCETCIEPFERDPEKYMATIRASRK